MAPSWPPPKKTTKKPHRNAQIPHFKKNKAVGIMKPGHVWGSQISTPVSGVKLWTWEGGLGELRFMLKVVKGDGKIGGNENLGGGLMIFCNFTLKLEASWSGLTRMFFRRVGSAINQKRT